MFKSFSILFFMASIGFVSCQSGHLGLPMEPRVKTVAGWTLEGSDSLGRLRVESRPCYYCGTTYEYDQKGGLALADLACGSRAETDLLLIPIPEEPGFQNFWER